MGVTNTRLLSATTLGAVLLGVAYPVASHAADISVLGTKLLLKSNGTSQRLVFLARTSLAAAPSVDPRQAGGMLTVSQFAGRESADLALPATGWRTDATATTFKFKPAPGGLPGVKVGLVKVGVRLKVVATTTGITLDEPSQGDILVAFTVGAERYCTTFVAPLKDTAGFFLSKRSLASACVADTATTSTSVPGTTSSTAPPTTTTTLSTCGNGVVDPGEQCDGSSCPGGRACRFDCTCPPSLCGNGVVDAAFGEECDPAGPGCPDGAPCTSICTCPVCGNGVVEPGEECDFAGAPCTDGNGCTADCTCRSIVVLDESVTDVSQTAADMTASYGLTNVELRTPLKQLSARVPAAGLAAMASDPAILLVQEVLTSSDVLKTCPVVNDPYTNTVQRVYAGGSIPSEPGVMDGSGVGVAVLDTGIRRDHPDLMARLRGGFNASQAASGLETHWDDDQGHGTAMAGIIAARGHVTGVAPGVDVYAVKVLRRGDRVDEAAVGRGLAWILDHSSSIKVVNASLGWEVGVCQDGGRCTRDADCGRCDGGDRDGEACLAPPYCPDGSCSPTGRCIGGRDAFLPCPVSSVDQCPGGGTCVLESAPCRPVVPSTCSPVVLGGYCRSGDESRLGKPCARSADCGIGGDVKACRLVDPNRELWCRLVSAGITVVAAAGNRPLPADWSYPANYQEVIAVGGLTDTDGRVGAIGCTPDCHPGYDEGPDDGFWPFGANTSPPVDILAPTGCLYSTALTPTGYDYAGGTSAAAAVVSAAAAVYIQAHPGALPVDVANGLRRSAQYMSAAHPILNNPMPGVGVVQICYDTQSDRNNCGRCGHVCLGDEVCSGGVCQAPDCGPPVVDNTGSCAPCVDYPTCAETVHCLHGIVYDNHYVVCNANGEDCVPYDASGFFGGPCTAPDGSLFPMSYTYSVCDTTNIPSCTSPVTVCGECACGGLACPTVSGGTQLGCIDPKTDSLNCGLCGNVCPSPLVCVDGECLPGF